MSQPPTGFFRGAFDALDRRLNLIESRLSTIDQGLTTLGRGYAALRHHLDRTALRQAEMDEPRRDPALLRERLAALEAP